MALFEDVFKAIEEDKEGKRFDRVSRIVGRADDHEGVELTLDYNCEIYKIPIGCKFELVIRSNLTDDTGASGAQEFDQTGKLFFHYHHKQKVSQSRKKTHPPNE